MELGQYFAENKDFSQSYEAYWATEGLEQIASEVSISRGLDPENGFVNLTGNVGGEEFENDVFYMSSFCWCGGDNKEHEEGCPPNFFHKESKLRIDWYKHAGRGIRANVEGLSKESWEKIVKGCINSVKNY